MMSNTLGAPFGGTIRGAHQAVDSEAFSLIIPPNAGGGGGSCFPSTVVVAPGEPGIPVTCWANAETQLRARRLAPASKLRLSFMNASAAFKNESLIAPKFACVDLNQNLTEEAASTGFVPSEAPICDVG